MRGRNIQVEAKSLPSNSGSLETPCSVLSLNKLLNCRSEAEQSTATSNREEVLNYHVLTYKPSFVHVFAASGTHLAWANKFKLSQVSHCIA